MYKITLPAIVLSLLLVAPTYAGCESVCRVANALPGGQTNLGSGTLVDVAADGRRGLVLTCAHLFSEGAGRVTVTFADGRCHGGRLIAKDAAADLAAIEIANPRAAPSDVSVGSSPSGNVDSPLTACGYGQTGQRRSLVGRLLGRAAGAGRESLRIQGAVRSGDSGGGVFNRRGELVAVVWGAAEGVTYATSGPPLQRFLAQFRLRQPLASSPKDSPPCENGVCPVVPPRDPLAVSRPKMKPAAPQPPLPHRKPRSVDREPPGESFQLDRETASVALAVLAIAAGGRWWLLRRRRRKETTAAAEPSFRTAAHETIVEDAAPIERDDREARQLLRLSQLEGRDPLQDALAGRLALDRLDEIAESDAREASFADSLRRELRERFNEIAPTKFELKGKEESGKGNPLAA